VPELLSCLLGGLSGVTTANLGEGGFPSALESHASSENQSELMSHYRYNPKELGLENGGHELGDLTVVASHIEKGNVA
jgi:hypothetical protein